MNGPASKTSLASALFVALAILLASPQARGTEDKAKSWTDMVSFGALWFLHAEYGDDGSRFRVSRGYLTARFRPVEWFTARMTLDSYLDDDGFEIRLKYIHGRFTLPIETPYVSKPFLEFGQVHAPWLNFEMYVNRYRMTGKMFLARNNLLDSSDLGVTVGALLGDVLSEEDQADIGSKGYAGRYGSVVVGLYNGGGYSVDEFNDNKVFEARVSVRPLGWFFPNLQLSYGFIHGRGNTEAEPLWQNHTAMASVTHRYFALSGTYARGYGALDGARVDGAGNALSNQGFSVFAEGRFPAIHSSLMGRFDWFDWEDTAPQSRLIIAYAFWFLGRNAIVIDGDMVLPNDGGALESWQVKLTLQVRYP